MIIIILQLSLTAGLQNKNIQASKRVILLNKYIVWILSFLSHQHRLHYLSVKTGAVFVLICH